MRWISDVWFRLRAIVSPGRMEREMGEEMAFHLEMETTKRVREGLTPEEATLRAHRDFGGVMREKERARDAWGIGLVQDLTSDVRQALRSLRRAPVFGVAAVLTLALGIGGATAVFSVVNGVLLKPLPFRDAGRLVAIQHVLRALSEDPIPLAPAFYFTFREHARTLREIGIYQERQVVVTGPERPERVPAVAMTEGLLAVLDIQPVLGRGFLAEETTPGGNSPVILSHGYWRRRFGGDAGALGMSVRVGGVDRQVVGVLPRGFALPGVRAELYLPLVFNASTLGVGDFSYPGIARLRPGATPEAAARELDALTGRATEGRRGISLETLRARRLTSLARPLRETVVGGAATTIWVVFGTVCLVLLVACANVANLFLVRAEARQQEIALRSALGAGWGRLARHLLTESLLVSLAGGVLGLLLASGGVQLLLRLAPTSIPRLDDIGLDPAAALFTFGVSLLAGVAFGAIPALRSGRGSLTDPLREGGRTSSSKRRIQWRTLFGVAQVAVALVLLVASGLMLKSYRALLAVPPGFADAAEVLTARVYVPAFEVPDVDAGTAVHQAILERVGGLPGVTAVGGAASVATEAWETWDDWMVEEFPLADGEASPLRRMNWIVPGYFETVRNRVLAGRTLEWADSYGRRNVVMVTENYAREYWGEPARALGKRIRNNPDSPWREIVGVVGNDYTRGVAAGAPSVIYLPFIAAGVWGPAPYSVRELRYVIRVSGRDPLSLVPEVRQVVWSVNPNLPISDVRTLDDILDPSVARASFTLVALGIAGGVALLLGMVGVYGVISYVVSRRTREIGVRMALGASRAQVIREVMRQGGAFAGLGIALGVALALGLTRFMSALLFGVSPADVPTYAVVAAVLAVVVLLASYLPARRASKVDPMVALRAE